MKKLLVLVWVLSLLGCSSHARLVKQQWYEIQSDHFRVFTDASPAEVEALTQDLERFRLSTRNLLQMTQADSEVLTIFALKDRTSYEGLVGAKLARKSLGIFYDDLYGSYALINLNGYYRYRDVTDSWARQFLFHEYTHYLMARGSTFSYPYWFREGYAEFLATAECDEMGECIYGRIPIDRATTLNRGGLLNLERLLTATPANTSGITVPKVYASGWLLTHKLMTGGTGNRKRLSKYLHAVNTGKDPVAAFETVFQSSLEESEEEYRAYTRGALSGFSLEYTDGFGEIRTESRKVESSRAVSELGKVLALRGEEDALQSLRQYAGSENIETQMLNYSIAFAQLKREFLQQAQLKSDAGEPEDRQERSNDFIVGLWQSDFDEQAFTDYWPRLVYAESLRWQVQKNPELRQAKLTQAYNLYKNIVKQNDTVAAAWFGLGVTASQLMVPASTYHKYLWKAYTLSPQSEQAALVYMDALYEAEMWPQFVNYGQVILPIISDPERRRYLDVMVDQIQKTLPKTAANQLSSDDA
ncbi:hypothetical protein [Pseudomaricurvus sp.]|uniref:hypothetical protein n=1 Tax=Pseudomaricurvus sp. TaxID=2004510 RepID=UPI003F6B2E2C